MANSHNNNRAQPSVEFIVKPREDLFLEGNLRKLPRVSKNEPYPCQMQKTQQFSCLFRHYAKHNGLEKNELSFFFVDELLPEQTPESVHLMNNDEIWVEHRIKQTDDNTKELEANMTSVYMANFRSLLETPIHSDVTFIVGDDCQEIRSHKAILSTRCEYFAAMFNRDWNEGSESKISIRQHDKATFNRMLEFIYTSTVKSLDSCQFQEIMNLLILSNEYCLDQLQNIVEIAASKILSYENIGRFTLVAMNYDMEVLKLACKNFLNNHVLELRKDDEFRRELVESPQLGLFLFDAFPSVDNSSFQSSSSTNSKRRKIGGVPTDPTDGVAMQYVPMPQAQIDQPPTNINGRDIW